MPSVALADWRSDRMLRLQEIENQCAASLAIVPPNPTLSDENLRGLALAISAHFQGFCRDLYEECAQAIVSRVRPSFQSLIQGQFKAHLHLNFGNPTIENLAKDFNRFDIDLIAHLNRDPANALRRHHLAALNKWRNVAAHQGTPLPIGVPLTLANLQLWKVACDELAAAIETIMYNKLRRLLRRNPW